MRVCLLLSSKYNAIVNCCCKTCIVQCSVSIPGRYWEMVDRLKITQFYTAPTALRLLIKCGNEHVTPYKRESLRVLGCGEHGLYKKSSVPYKL